MRAVRLIGEIVLMVVVCAVGVVVAAGAAVMIALRDTLGHGPDWP